MKIPAQHLWASRSVIQRGMTEGAVIFIYGGTYFENNKPDVRWSTSAVQQDPALLGLYGGFQIALYIGADSQLHPAAAPFLLK